MHYFPLFTDLNGKEILICGGGSHAVEKIKRLLPFGAYIRVISEDVSEEILHMDSVSVENRRFCEEDLDSFPVFVVAAENREKNEFIARLCKARHIPVNAVDMQDLCDIIFPSVILRENLCIGISTGGASPAASVAIKNAVESNLPDQIDGILDWLCEKRAFIRSEISDKNRQRYILCEAAKKTVKLGRPLTDNEFDEIINISKII
ncbi:MAG: bifunctional precorrin-2 dehydrogenase/sirohydrochlorin ferrochelatase [Clostridia bacterium]|nr:bifunctional precorrin-2 dehydrogenase/sirohydrochlorin ferrochelatase [Clostridia bacterium]